MEYEMQAGLAWAGCQPNRVHATMRSLFIDKKKAYILFIKFALVVGANVLSLAF